MDQDTPGTARASADGVAPHAAAWLDRLSAVGPALAGARTAGDVAAAVVDHGLAALGAAEGLLAVPAPDGRGLAVLYAARADGLPREARPADLAGGGPLADVAAGGSGVWAGKDGVLPLRVGGETIGVLRFTAPAARAFDGARPFAEALALQAALALDRLRQHAAAEAARTDAAVERARAAFHVALADILRPLDDPFAIQAEAAALLGRRLGVSRAFYAEADGDRLVISRDYVDGVPHSTGRYRLDEFSRDVAAAFRAGRTLAVDDVERNPSLSDEERARYAAGQVRAHATVCLVRDGRLVAMLGVRQTTPRAWSAEDVALMEAAAERTWAHVARARAEEERAAAERERAASERQLRIITDAVPALIAYVDREQRYRFVNRAYTEWFGRTPAQVIGRTSMEVLDPEVYENARPAIEAALRGEPATIEREITVADGRSRYIRSRLIPDVGADGTVRGYLALVVDLTEDRAREDALRESESRYRALFTAIDEGYCLCELIHDADGNAVDYRFLEVNPLFSSMTGLPADAPGHTARELVPDLEPEWIATYAAVAYGEPSRFEQGSEAMGRWFDVFAMPVEPRGRFALVFKDVTERKRAADALRASEERFRQMANTAPAMLWVTDPDGACVFLSEAWYVYTGQTEAEGVGLGWLDAVHPDDRAETAEAFLAALARRAPFALDHRLRRADGVYRGVVDAGRPWIAPDGTFLGYVGAVLDVHDRRVAEDALREANETLEARVEARTAEVRALSSALTLAEQHERERLSRVLHDDLQQVLYGLQLRIHAFSSDAPPHLTDDVRALTALIRDAIHTTRTLSIELAPPVLKGEGLPQALRWLGTHVGQAHGLQVQTDVRADGHAEPLTEEGRVLLFQVAREFLFNVAKHAGTDRARLSLDHHPDRTGDSGGFLVLDVADDGIGFDPAALTGRADGLGLASLRDRLAYLGGHLDVAAAAGAGTRARAVLPLDAITPRDAAPPVDAPPPHDSADDSPASDPFGSGGV